MFSVKHYRRLMKLADKMESVSKKEFNWSHWFEKTDSPNRNECQTSACVLGWACTVPALKRAGLQMKYKKWECGDGTSVTRGDVRFSPKTPDDRKTCRAAYKGYYGVAMPRTVGVGGIMAGAGLFGLTYHEAEELFVPNGACLDPTPKQMASRIRELAERKLREAKATKAAA